MAHAHARTKKRPLPQGGHNACYWWISSNFRCTFVCMCFGLSTAILSMPVSKCAWTLDTAHWTLDIGQWDNGQWTIDIGPLTLNNGQWTLTLENEKWKMENGIWTLNIGHWTMEIGI